MRFNLPRLLFATLLIPLTAALQTIYLAYIGSSGFPHYVAFFSDSNPCTDSTVVGFTPSGFDDCNEPFTLLGHQGLTFTGCNSSDPYSPAALPKGVSDGGTPALKCKPTSNPPGGPYGAYVNCPYTPTAPLAGPVELLEYCS